MGASNLNKEMAEQKLNLNYIWSQCTLKKDLVTGMDVGYLVLCSTFFHFFWGVNVGLFFLCGMLWMVLPSNILTPNQFDCIFQRYPVLTKFFYHRSNLIKVKES